MAAALAAMALLGGLPAQAAGVGKMFAQSGARGEPGDARAGKKLNAKDFGAVPDWDGTAGTNNTAAFVNALAKLKAAGGGTLVVPPGDYYFGAYSKSLNIVAVTGLSDALISAYGARFIVNTTAEATPFLFAFINPNNVVMAGGKFLDVGFNPASWTKHKRWGMAAVRLDATAASKGFKLMDCEAENLTYLLVADLRANKRKLSNISVTDCKVKNAYYGVDVLYVGDNLKIENLVCEDVRRGLVSFGLRNADADIKLHTSSGFLGSNGFISIAAEGTTYNDGYGVLGDNGNVENVRIKLSVSGYEAHTSYVHFYHQQANSPGEIANVVADVKINNLSATGKDARLGKTNVFLFDHESPGAKTLGKTKRIFKKISLSGDIVGNVSGTSVMVGSNNPDVPAGISISPSLARPAKRPD